jgi:hypothetical protein
MKMKPEERPKIIALAAAIVLVLCLFGFTVVPRLLPHGPNGELLSGSAAASAAAPPVAAASPLPSAAPPIASAAPTIAGGTPTPTPGPANDPFWRPLALSLLQSKQNSVQPRKTTPTLPSLTQPGFSPASGRLKLAPIMPPPLPEVELQGIVQDETAIAVLSVDGQSRFLKTGESLEGGWTLLRIQTSAVVLRQGKREVVLILGQPRQKETPQGTPDRKGIAETLPPFHTITLQP